MKTTRSDPYGTLAFQVCVCKFMDWNRTIRHRTIDWSVHLYC